MNQNESRLDLPEEELLDIDPEVMEHALWFTAEDDLNSDKTPLKKNEENKRHKIHKEDSGDQAKIATTQQDKQSYSNLIHNQDESLQLVLKAHFLEKCNLSLSKEEKKDFMNIVGQYQDYYDNGTVPENIKVLNIIEAHYLLDDFLEIADAYDDNPVYFLKKTVNYPMPPDMLEKAQNMDDEEIIYLFSRFCKFCPKEKESVLDEPETIKTKDIISVIQKLATCEQID